MGIVKSLLIGVLLSNPCGAVGNSLQKAPYIRPIFSKAGGWTYLPFCITDTQCVLIVPFKIKQGILSLRIVPPYTDPATEKVCLVSGNRVSPINDLNELRGKVEIQSEAQALAFVRLRTSPRTFDAFDSAQGALGLEVLIAQPNYNQIVFGDEGFAKSMLHNKPSGYFGIISAQEGETLGIRPAKCIKSGNGFEIRRTILREEWAKRTTKFRLYQIVERVERDGAYSIKKRTPFLPKGPDHIQWYVPEQM